jgi:hypothetical protein
VQLVFLDFVLIWIAVLFLLQDLFPVVMALRVPSGSGTVSFQCHPAHHLLIGLETTKYIVNAVMKVLLGVQDSILLKQEKVSK